MALTHINIGPLAQSELQKFDLNRPLPLLCNFQNSRLQSSADQVLSKCSNLSKYSQRRLEAAKYILNATELKTVFLACKMEKPIIVEGPPGCGKTALANVIAAAGQTGMVRLQCYPGITADKVIGKFDEALQKIFAGPRSKEVEGIWQAICERMHSLEFFAPGPLSVWNRSMWPATLSNCKHNTPRRLSSNIWQPFGCCSTGWSLAKLFAEPRPLRAWPAP